MRDIQLKKQKAILRERLGRFFANRAHERRHLMDALSKLRGFAGPAFIFGGVLRDLMLHGSSISPRDVDVVVGTVDLTDVRAVFSENLTHTNRFGGLHLRVGGWHFDVWPLARTWALSQKIVVPSTFEALPRTTFLNVEAVAARLDTEDWQYREIFSHGFFESMLSRTVEINCAPNPYPALCVLRSLMIAARLNFAIGPNLVDYILSYSRELGVDALMHTQWEHYGQIFYRVHDLNSWLSSIAKQRTVSKRSRIKLPTRDRQMALFQSRAAEAGREKVRGNRKAKGLVWH
jgi:hypothetical protein